MKPIKLLIYKSISCLENIIIHSISRDNNYPPLFIVGAPRAGTTLIYQYLVNSYEFGYFPNIAKLNPCACVSYAFIGKLFYKYVPKFESKYGVVSGALSPSDGWSIFLRWFPKYDSFEKVKIESLYELKNIIHFYEKLFDAPFINKNNGNSIRIKFLDSLFSNAIFLHVRREIKDAIISLLEARRFHKVPLNDWWSAAPPQYFRNKFNSEFEQAVYTVHGLDSFILTSLEIIPPERKLIVSYEDFCNDPARLGRQLVDVYEKFNISIKRRNNDIPTSFPIKTHNLSSKQVRELEITLDKINYS
jgi:hypothetical protein